MNLLVMCVGLVFLLAVSAPAETYVVDQAGTGDFTTIQDAANVVAEHDTILVLPGVYHENVVFPYPAPSMSLIGADPLSTVIDAGGVDKCIRIHNWSGSHGLVQGFTLQNSGTGYTGGIANCGIVIHTSGTGDWTITGNVFRDHPFAGVMTTDGGVVSENLFVDNEGDGVFVSASASATVLGNDFVHCGGAVRAHPQAYEAVLTANIVASCHYGVTIGEGVSASLGCNNIWDVAYPYVGCDPGEGDFQEDPLFCDPVLGDFSLRSDSPCLPGNHPQGWDCGLVGAFTEGCVASAVVPATWTLIKSHFRE
jgi:hypothetical protein